MDSDEPLLIDTGRGFTVKYKNRYLYSSVDPVRSIEERIRSLEFGDETLVFVPSLGLGYGLRDLLARLPGSCHILCVEVDQRLMAMALKRNPVPLPLSPRLTVVRSESDEQIVSVLHSLGVDRFRRVLTVRLSGGYYLNRGTYDSFARCLEEEVQTFWKNKMTLFHMGELWIRNILQNLDQIRRSSDITSLGTALPVLVTGAGPSLEENLGLIRKIRERVVVLTVDTALSVLEGGGIKPDIILALEAQIANLQDFIGHTSSGVPLLCDISCSPSVVRLFAESSFFFSSSFYPLELFSRMKAAGLLPEPIPPLGSVGVAAVYIALGLTSGPVFQTGLDFSYPRGQTHARSSPFHNQMLFRIDRLHPPGQLSYERIQARPLLKLKGKDGKPILSDLILHSYANQVRNLARSYPRIFDLSKQGLDTGAPVLDSESALISRLGPARREQGRPESPYGSLFISGRKSSGRSTVYRAFVKNERVRLEKGAELVNRFLLDLRDKSAGGLSADEEKQLRELDYLYYYFPDRTPLPVLRRDFLVRLLSAIQTFLPLWQRL